MTLQRWKWTIAYDGAPYGGWQSQPGGNTIQDHLEAALSEIRGLPSGTRVHGSGRTDAGVHAYGQVAHIDAPIDLSLDAKAWPHALNARLPGSIRVLVAEAVPQDFHARFSASEKTYVYRLYLGKILPPMLWNRVWHIHNSLDVGALRHAGQCLRGRHDFKAFAANRGKNSPPPATTVRNLTKVEILEEPDNQLVLSFTADGFLYRMVRMLTGTMVRFAQGKLSESDLLSLLDDRELLKTSACAPAGGLYLRDVAYHPRG